MFSSETNSENFVASLARTEPPTVCAVHGLLSSVFDCLGFGSSIWVLLDGTMGWIPHTFVLEVLRRGHEIAQTGLEL